MTTATLAAPARDLKPDTFPRVVTSEWIKLRTVRATVWTLSDTVAVMVAIAALGAWSSTEFFEDGATFAPASFPIAGWYFAQLVVVVLGVLSVTGEYSTGMIRSTFAAVPARVPALLAKALTVFGAVFAVSTVQEEIGLRGAKTSAYSIDPQIAIAVDVTHATDTPDSDRNEPGRIDLGGGPVVFRGPNVNPVLFERLIALAKANEIPVQISALATGASNDGNALQLNRSGPATGIIGIPNRYMHSPVEVCSLTDLDHAANLLAALCCDLKADADFTP